MWNKTYIFRAHKTKIFLVFVLFLLSPFLAGQNSKKIIADSLLKLSSDNLVNDNFTQAILNASRCLELYEGINDTKGVADCEYQLAESYISINEYKKAFDFVKKSMNEYEHLEDKKGIADCYEVLGNYFEYQEQDLKQAKLNYSHGIKYCDAINYKKRKAYLLGNIARIYFKQRDYDTSYIYNLESLKLKEEVGDKKGVGYSFHKIGQIYLAKGNIDKAKEFAQKSMDLAQSNQYLENIKRSADLLNQIYKKQGDYKLASEMFELYIKSRDSINNIAAQKIALQKEMQYEFDKKEAIDKAEQAKKDALTDAENKRNKIILIGVFSFLCVVVLLASFIFRNLKITQKQKLVIEQKEKETNHQKRIIEEKQHEIIESITYAKRLQEAILPPFGFINFYIPEHFILYKPKDIVAGDFYWADAVGDLFFIAAADCTGHGVPGAMVSMVCSNALSRSVNEFHLTETGQILDKSRELVVDNFAKSATEVKDGMDISLICIDKKNRKITWSGANNPLWYVCNGELSEIKANKQPIGKTDDPKPFSTNEIKYNEGTIFYLFTDGFADQFGGPNGKKFKYKQLADILLANSNRLVTDQTKILDRHFEDWRGSLEQVDDVCIIGIRI